MIEGVVNANLEAVVTIPLQGPSGQTQEVDAVIDTGFNGYLALPPTLVADLGLPVVGEADAVLADGCGRAAQKAVPYTANPSPPSPVRGIQD